MEGTINRVVTSLLFTLLPVTVVAGCSASSAQPESQSLGFDPSKPVDVNKLHPLFGKIGHSGSVPDAIVVELSSAIIGNADGQISGETKATIAPPIAGNWRHTGVAELTFTPDTPFAYDTHYKVEISAIATVDGALDVGSKPWSYSFRTPKFAVLGWEPSSIDLPGHLVTMRLAFAGASLLHLAKDQLTFSIDGKSISSSSMAVDDKSSEILVTFADARIRQGSRLGVSQRKDGNAVVDRFAAAIDRRDFIDEKLATYALSGDNIVAVHNVAYHEDDGASYIEFECEHVVKALMSRPCLLGDAAMSAITFEPAVANRRMATVGGRTRIYGDYARGVYEVQVAITAKTKDDGDMLRRFSSSFAVQARTPALSFVGSGRYLPRSAWNNLGIRHVSVDTAKLTVRQIPAANLVYWLSAPYENDPDERVSDIVLEKTIALGSDSIGAKTTWLDVGSLLPASTTGILELRIEGLGATASSRLLLTNLSLIAKRSFSKETPWLQTVRMWAIDMDSAKPINGVAMSFVNGNNFPLKIGNGSVGGQRSAPATRRWRRGKA
jgi:alpha-2-macroglobulin